jgi:hypothetical protein
LSRNSILNPSKWSPPRSVQDSFAHSSLAEDPTSDLVAMSRQLTEGGYPMPVYLPKSLVFAAKSIGGISFPTLPTGIANGTFPDPTEFHPA